MIAVLLGLSFLLPDEKLAPVFIVSILTFGSWKYGLINWFWINPLATYWAIINLAELIDSNGFVNILPQQFNNFLIDGFFAAKLKKYD